MFGAQHLVPYRSAPVNGSEVTEVTASRGALKPATVLIGSDVALPDRVGITTGRDIREGCAPAPVSA